MLVVGALVWALTENLVAIIVLLGSFLVPVALVLFALARAGDGELSGEHIHPRPIGLNFVIGTV